MKNVLFGFMICAFVLTITGCDKAQQIIDATDKAKAFTTDMEKKAKEIIPESARKLFPGKEKESGEKKKKDKDD